MRRLVLLLALGALTAGCGSSSSAEHAKNGPIVFTDSIRPFNGITLRAESGKLRKLDADRADFYATWSPDGKKIAFLRSLGNGKAHLFLMNADGSGLHQVPGVTTDAGGIDWSPDGSEIAFGDGKGISSVRTDGSGRRRIVDKGSSPAWSADGTIVFWRAPSLYAVDDDGTGVHAFLVPPASDRHFYTLLAPAWSRDGKQLVFVRVDLAAGLSGKQGTIEVVDADGGGERTLADIYSSRGESVRAVWSPDGTTIAYGDYRSSSFHGGIYTVPSAGGKPTLIVDEFTYSLPSWGAAGT